MKDQKIKRSKDQKINRSIDLIYRFIDLSTYGHCRGKHALEEGGQEVAPSQRALAGEAGHCQSHDGPHGGGGVCNEARRAPGGQRQAQAEEGC